MFFSRQRRQHHGNNFVSLYLGAISFGAESVDCIYLDGKHKIDLVPSEPLLKVRNATASVFCAQS